MLSHKENATVESIWILLPSGYLTGRASPEVRIAPDRVWLSRPKERSTATRDYRVSWRVAQTADVALHAQHLQFRRRRDYTRDQGAQSAPARLSIARGDSSIAVPFSDERFAIFPAHIVALMDKFMPKRQFYREVLNRQDGSNADP